MRLDKWAVTAQEAQAALGIAGDVGGFRGCTNTPAFKALSLDS